MDKFMYETSKTALLKEVYNHLEDEESQKIYVARSLFSLSDDNTYMTEIVRNMTLSKTLVEKLTLHKDRILVLFGAGTWGKAILQFFPEIKWDYIVDNCKSGQVIKGNRIVSLSDIQKYNECYFVISVLFDYRAIVQQLLSLGVPEENMLILGEIATQRQYFDLPYLDFSENEIFIDAGGFNGDTTVKFAKTTGGRYKQIYVFEPNQKLSSECRTNLADLTNCMIIQKGVWDSKQVLRFVEAEEGSRIVDEMEDLSEIETDTIDDVLEGKPATYIKMDVEGAEINALKGARKTICKYKPKLAISVYHKRDDIWEIPMLLLRYNPEYRFYLRVYSFTGNDTVLYAL